MSGPARAQVAELLARMTDVHVLVVGDLMLDRYITGHVDRISPEAPVPVVRVEGESSALGGAANVAANVVALGARCSVVGCVGRDEGGRLLVEALRAGGVDARGVVTAAGRPTTVKTRVLARRQQVVRFDQELDDDVPGDVAEAVADAIREGSARTHALVLQDYNKGVLVPPVIEASLGEARGRELPTVVDPKRFRFFAFPGATVFKPNAKELGDALGERLQPEDAAWMLATRSRLCCENLLLTLGERGVALATRSGEHLCVPARARSVYDVSGAGDTITAVVATAMAAGADVLTASVLANHAAAIEVGKAGVATVSPEEILGHYENLQEESV